MSTERLPVYKSGVYRNLFKETGKTDAEIDAKMEGAVRDFFHGDSETGCCCTFGTDEAYVLDTGNTDIRSEGVSYGMMIAVQAGLKEEFDGLWNFARRRMRHDEGDNEGYFAWQLNTDGTVRSHTSAPDGEEYFAMSLFFAWKRWGDPAYKDAADDILHHMLHQDLYAAPASLITRMIDPGTRQVVFVPERGHGAEFTDASYHLPAFYELFALWAAADNAYWKEVAAASRAFLRTAAHPVTGLYPDYSFFDGRPADPFNQRHDCFRPDAWRVIQNLAMDWAWFNGDPGEVKAVDRIQAFFAPRGFGSQGSAYTLEGQELVNVSSPGLVAMNAAGSLAAANPQALDFVERLWAIRPMRGKWRYYNNCLHLFALLHCAGRYRMIGATQAPD